MPPHAPLPCALLAAALALAGTPAAAADDPPTFSERLNTTGDPLGGGPGYRRVYTAEPVAGEPVRVVRTVAELLATTESYFDRDLGRVVHPAAPAEPGQRVFVAAADYDLSRALRLRWRGREGDRPAVRVTGDRGVPNPNGSSRPGARLFTSHAWSHAGPHLGKGGVSTWFLLELGRGNELAGLIVEGSNPYGQALNHESTQFDGNSSGIGFPDEVNTLDDFGAEVHNVEVRGFDGLAVHAEVMEGVSVHHSHLHHNGQPGFGYGLYVSQALRTGDRFAEAVPMTAFGNLFSHNKHSVDESGPGGGPDGYKLMEWRLTDSAILGPHGSAEIGGHNSSPAGRPDWTGWRRTVQRVAVLYEGKGKGPIGTQGGPPPAAGLAPAGRHVYRDLWLSEPDGRIGMLGVHADAAPSLRYEEPAGDAGGVIEIPGAHGPGLFRGLEAGQTVTLRGGGRPDTRHRLAGAAVRTAPAEYPWLTHSTVLTFDPATPIPAPDARGRRPNLFYDLYLPLATFVHGREEFDPNWRDRFGAVGEIVVERVSNLADGWKAALPRAVAALDAAAVAAGGAVTLSTASVDPEGHAIAYHHVHFGDGRDPVSSRETLFGNGALSHAYERPGTYLVTVRAFNEHGVPSDPWEGWVEVAPPSAPGRRILTATVKPDFPPTTLNHPELGDHRGVWQWGLEIVTGGETRTVFERDAWEAGGWQHLVVDVTDATTPGVPSELRWFVRRQSPAGDPLRAPDGFALAVFAQRLWGAESSLNEPGVGTFRNDRDVIAWGAKDLGRTVTPGDAEGFGSLILTSGAGTVGGGATRTRTVTVAPAPERPDGAGLHARYLFDETAGPRRDSGEHGRDLSDVDAAVARVPGLHGGAVAFGGGRLATAAGERHAPDPAQSFTLAARFRAAGDGTNGGGTGPFDLLQASGRTKFRWLCEPNSRRLRFAVDDAAGGRHELKATLPPNGPLHETDADAPDRGGWRSAVVWWDAEAQALSMRVDAAPAIVERIPGGLGTRIDGRVSLGGGDGVLDELILFQRALGAAEREWFLRGGTFGE